MKTKLALLATVTLIGIGATRALAGRVGNDFPATPVATIVTDKPAAKGGCCGMNQTAATKPAGQDSAEHAGMSCHAAQSDKAPTTHKSCCK